MVKAEIDPTGLKVATEQLTLDMWNARECLNSDNIDIYTSPLLPERLLRTSILWGGGDATAEDVEAVNDTYKELQRDYGINIPPYEMIKVGDNYVDERSFRPKEPVGVITLIDKVFGRTLNDELRAPDSTLENDELEQFYAGLVQYCGDKCLRPEGIMLRDIDRNAQYMYGTTTSDDTPRIYLVDIDPDCQDLEKYEIFLAVKVTKQVLLMMREAQATREIDLEVMRAEIADTASFIAATPASNIIRRNCGRYMLNWQPMESKDISRIA